MDGRTVVITRDDLVVTETPRQGWAVASDAGETVALDLEITPELREAGLVREAVRLIQEARKASGLEVTDRIELWWSADGDELTSALRAQSASLGAEVLAPVPAQGPPNADITPHVDPELGLTVWLRCAGR